MTTEATVTSRFLAPLAEGFERLKKLMSDLGLNLSVWSAPEEAIEECSPACELCQTICNARAGCREFSRKLFQRVVDEGEPISDRTATGCCVLGVPVRSRRRLLGAAVACMPVREMLDREFLTHLCERLELDRQATESLAGKSIRHCTQEAPDFLLVLDGLLKQEQAQLVAKGELSTLIANLVTTYEELSLLYRISKSMRVTQQPDAFLQNICNELLDVMNIQGAVAIVYPHPPTTESDAVVVAGELGLSEGQLKALADQEISAKFASDHRAILNNNFSASNDDRFHGAVRNLIAVPLVMDEDSIGMLVGLNKFPGDFDSVDLKLINAIGSQAAVFLANNQLYADLQDLLMGVLHALTATIDAKDPYTCGHSQRVAMISRRLAQECGFDQEKVQQIYLAGVLHDIGKIGVPEAILCKKGRLTDEEFTDIKRHPMIGAKILGGIRQLDEIVAGILTHHERPDGTGYPQGLKGDDVPIEGRIIGLADSFDAMTSDRTYRNALPLDVVVKEIREWSGRQFDEGIVERFLSLDLGEFMIDMDEPEKTVFPLRAGGS